MATIRSVVCGNGHYLPERILTNRELAGMVDTSHEWIVQRTGIEERHIAAEGETTSMLGLKAAERALADAKLEAEGHRPHRLRDLDAGLHLPVDGDADPGRARHPPRRRLRPAGGVHRLRLRRRDGRQVPHLRLPQARPRHRRRDFLAHPRLEGPHHLRPVRRRRRRDRARGTARRGHAAGPRRPDLASALGRRATATSSTSMAARARRRPPAA